MQGFEAGTASGRVLTGDAIDAHNTFDDPDVVIPAELAVTTNEGGPPEVPLGGDATARSP